MVRFLICDISGHRRNGRFTHAKCPVSGLPREFDVPFWCRHLDEFVLITRAISADEWVGSSPCQHVHVIAGAIDDQGSAAHFANYSAEVRQEIGTDFAGDERPPAFRTEDQMDNNVSAGLSQGFLRPFRAYFFVSTQGLRPRLHSSATSRLLDCHASGLSRM